MGRTHKTPNIIAGTFTQITLEQPQPTVPKFLVFFLLVIASIYSVYSICRNAVYPQIHPPFGPIHPLPSANVPTICAASSYGMGVKTTNELLQSWRVAMTAQSFSARTITERLRLINQFESMTRVPAFEATSDDLVNWFAVLPSLATRHSYYYGMNSWYKWLNLNDYRLDNPIIRVPKFKQPRRAPRPITTSQLQAVLELKMRPATRTRILFGAFAGLRIHEIAKIDGRELNTIDGLLEVTGKGALTHVIPLHPILLEEAKQYPAKGYWFPPEQPNGRRPHVAPHSVAQSITTAFKRVGVEMTAHQLRHYFATSLLASGVDSRIVQMLMRHESLATTAKYMGVSIPQQQEALTKLDMTCFLSISG